jgi:hypothetical protein
MEQNAHNMRQALCAFLSDERNPLDTIVAAAEVLIADAICICTPPSLPRVPHPVSRSGKEIMGIISEWFDRYRGLCDQCKSSVAEYHKTNNADELIVQFASIQKALREMGKSRPL